MAEIIPLSGKFEDMRTFLAHIANDPEAVGFIGVIVRNTPDGRMLVRVNYQATNSEAALASCVLAKMAIEGELA